MRLFLWNLHPLLHRPNSILSFTSPISFPSFVVSATLSSRKQSSNMAKNIEKMSADEILVVSKKLFYGGFCLLPFLWVYNLLYIWPARNRPDISPQVRHYLMMSAILALGMFVVFSVWFGIFVNERLGWGAAGDTLTVVLVKGV